MQIDFFRNFYKKENSTKRPEPGAGHLEIKQTVSGHLKEPCSILHPVISLQAPPDASMPPDFFRYAYIPLFSRYYWVDDWSWEDGLWTVHLDVDVLATYRNDIGEETEYILRTDSDTSDFNGAITDTMYPATTNFDIEEVPFTNPFVTTLSQGSYVVGIINKNSASSVGAITYYAMTPAQFGALKDTLFSDANLEIMGILDNLGNLNIDDMSKELFRTMYNPYQYIASCMWFPLTISQFTGDTVTSIDLGWWNYPSLSGLKLTQQVGQFFDGVTQIPVHPQASTRGKYLNYNPYTKLTLYGKFGTLPIDTSYLEIGSYLINSYKVDFITGETIFEVYIADHSAGTNRKLISKTNFLLGTPIQLAQVGIDYLGTATQALSAGGDLMSGAIQGFMAGGVAGAVAGAVTNSASGIYNAINTAMPQLITSSANGSFANSQISTILVALHFIIVDEDIHHRGRPLCAMRKINTLSGYVLCAEGDIDLNAYDSERQEVKQFLTTGFFWE